jgi:hypothetical protein
VEPSLILLFSVQGHTGKKKKAMTSSTLSLGLIVVAVVGAA